jgi:hypothetical protein
MCCFLPRKKRNKKRNWQSDMYDVSSDWQLQDPSWIQRLQQHLHMGAERYLLSNPGDTIVAEQLKCYPKAEVKFPSWHKTGLLYARLALEQSSGEHAARYKASLIVGNEVWDLTGGLGIDSYAFSIHADRIIHNEPNKALSKLAEHNHTVLGASGIAYHYEKAENTLKTIVKTDTIYVDPSRRNAHLRTFLLQDCEPNVLEILDNLKQKANRVIIKLSPLYDINRVYKELPGTKEIHVVSVHGEVREILAVIDPTLTEQIISVVLPESFCLRRDPSAGTQSLIEQGIPESGMWLHVADPAVYKAGTLYQLAKEYQLTTFGTGGYLYSDHDSIDMCKSYRIESCALYKPKELKATLRGKRVNIHKRNFPIEVSQLYKQLGASMGDDLHLFFTTTSDRKMWVCITTPHSKL